MSPDANPLYRAIQDYYARTCGWPHRIEVSPDVSPDCIYVGERDGEPVMMLGTLTWEWALDSLPGSPEQVTKLYGLAVENRGHPAQVRHK